MMNKLGGIFLDMTLHTARTFPERFNDAFVTELQAFVDCVLDDTVSPVSGRDNGLSFVSF